MENISEFMVAIIPLIALQVILAIWGLIDLSKRRIVKYLPKVAWALIILFVTLGPVVYMLIGRGEE